MKIANNSIGEQRQGTEESTMNEEIVVYRMKELTQRLKRSKTQIYVDIAAGTFPRGVLLGARTRAWTKREIEEWLASRPAA